jgi:hypothetical protein
MADSTSAQGGWALWQFTRDDAGVEGGPNVNLVHLRDVPDAESARIRDALRIAGTINGHYLIGPFIRSANRVRAIIEQIREQPGPRSMDLQVRLELSMALDEWLVSFNSLRRRTEREVRQVLGEAAGADAAAKFNNLYRDDLDFRLVWEWRNAAQHTINPVDITYITASRDGDQRQVHWVLDGARAASCGHHWRSQKVLDHMTPTLDGVELMNRVVALCNDVMCQIMIDNEIVIDDAAELLLAVFAERQDDKPGARVLGRVGGGDSEQPWEWVAVRWDLPGHLVAQLEGARSHLGLPRKWPQIELGDGGE